MSTLLFVAALLSSALADDPAYGQAVSLYREFEYEQALLRFERLSVDPARAPAEQVEVLMWMGICAAELGQDARARAAFDGALGRAPDAALPTSVSPKISALFEQARAAVRAQAAPAAAPVVDAAPPAAADDGGGGAPMLWGGVGLAGLGTAALVGSGVLGALFVGAAARAADPDGFQSDKVAAATEANAEVAGAITLGVVGLAAVGLGAFALVWSFVE